MRGITHHSLIALRETLSQSSPTGKLSLTEFGRILGKAARGFPYSRSYISKLLTERKIITPQVARAARVLMVSAAALEQKDWMDPPASFDGGPIAQLKKAKTEGVSWQGLYASNAEVRAFVDALVDVIVRG